MPQNIHNQQGEDDLRHQLARKGLLSQQTEGIQSISDADVNAHLLPAVSALSERVHMKMKRLSKIRSYFEAQCKKALATQALAKDNADTRVELLGSRITACGGELQRLK